MAMIAGPDPEMPATGDPLTADQVALIAGWIAAGAKRDGPAPAARKTAAHPVYQAANTRNGRGSCFVLFHYVLCQGCYRLVRKWPLPGIGFQRYSVPESLNEQLKLYHARASCST